MSQSDREKMSQDLAFDLLSNPRRRYLLSYLNQVDGSINIFELAEEIAAWENDIDVSEVSTQQQKRVYVSLYQTHLPKLEKAGVVEYDSDSRTVRLTEKSRTFSRYLPSDEESRPWHLYYLGLAVLSGITVVLTLANVPVFAAVPIEVVEVGIVLAFLVLASVHVYVIRRGDAEQGWKWLER